VCYARPADEDPEARCGGGFGGGGGGRGGFRGFQVGVLQSYAKHHNKTSDIIPEEKCGGGYGGGGYGGGGYGGGGYRNGGRNNGGAGNGGAGTVTGVQPLSDGSYLLYCALSYGKPVNDTDPEARCYGGGYGYGGYPVYIPVPVATNGAPGTGTAANPNVPQVTGVQQLSDGTLLLYNGNTIIGRTLPGRTINTPNGPLNTGTAQPVPAAANNVPQITGQSQPNGPNGPTILYSGQTPVAQLPAGYTIVPPANNGK
ncbi:unnamed protein product, partial [Oppiella nova]